jgi:glycerate 2-kinase
MDSRVIAEQIFLAGVNRVTPSKLIPSHLSVRDNILEIGRNRYLLNEIEKIYVIGAGKASAMMAAEVEKILGNLITSGHVVVKYGHSCKLKKIKVTEAGHPVPDSNGFHATKEIIRIAKSAGQKDLVICLLSGGGSALLADFPEGSSAKEMVLLNGLLVNSGAGITEINAVRKHLSEVKGGQLARIVYPAALESLILSDVPGDQIDVIASGPTIADPTTFVQAMDVLTRFNLLSSVPAGIIRYLKDGTNGNRPETPKDSDIVFQKTTNHLVGSNKLALEAAMQKALEYNINPVLIDDQLQGDISSVAEYLVGTAKQFQSDTIEIKPVCLLFGGETTVKMTGRGRGGRNQHLALLASVLLEDSRGITILCAGTDGNDGTTEAAGAVVDSSTFIEAASKNISPEEFLDNFDSYHFFKKAGGHIITGPTNTNVMDLIIIIVE